MFIIKLWLCMRLNDETDLLNYIVWPYIRQTVPPTRTAHAGQMFSTIRRSSPWSPAQPPKHHSIFASSLLSFKGEYIYIYSYLRLMLANNTPLPVRQYKSPQLLHKSHCCANQSRPCWCVSRRFWLPTSAAPRIYGKLVALKTRICTDMCWTRLVLVKRNTHTHIYIY